MFVQLPETVFTGQGRDADKLQTWQCLLLAQASACVVWVCMGYNDELAMVLLCCCIRASSVRFLKERCLSTTGVIMDNLPQGKP